MRKVDQTPYSKMIIAFEQKVNGRLNLNGLARDLVNEQGCAIGRKKLLKQAKFASNWNDIITISSFSTLGIDDHQ